MTVTDCVSTMGVCLTVLLPTCIWSLLALKHVENWEMINYSLVFIIYIIFLVGFYSGYCCGKSWGNWLMFYTVAFGMVIMLGISILFWMIGVEGFGAVEQMLEDEKVLIYAHEDKRKGPANYLNFIL